MPTENKEFYEKYVGPNLAMIGIGIGTVIAALSARFLLSKPPLATVEKILEDHEITKKDVDFGKIAIGKKLDKKGESFKKLLFSKKEKSVEATKIKADKVLSKLKEQVTQAVKQNIEDEGIDHNYLNFLFELSLHLLAKLPEKNPNRDTLFGEMEGIVTIFSSHRAFQIENKYLLGVFADDNNPDIELIKSDNETLYIKTQDVGKIFTIHNMIAGSPFRNNESFYDKNAMSKSLAWALFCNDIEATKTLISIFCEKHCIDKSENKDRINSETLREFMSDDGVNFKMSIQSQESDSLNILYLILQISGNLDIVQNDFGENSTRAIEDVLSNLKTNIEAIKSIGEIEKVTKDDLRLSHLNAIKLKILRSCGGDARPLKIQNKDGTVEITASDVAMVEEITAFSSDSPVLSFRNISKVVLEKAFPFVDKDRMERNLDGIQTRVSKNSGTVGGVPAAAKPPTPSPVAKAVEAEDEWFDAITANDYETEEGGAKAATVKESASEIEERLQQKFDEQIRELRAQSMAEIVDLRVTIDALEVNLELSKTAENGAKAEAETEKNRANHAEQQRRAAQSKEVKISAELKATQDKLTELKAKKGEVKKLSVAAGAANVRAKEKEHEAMESKAEAKILADSNVDLLRQKGLLETELVTLRENLEAEKTRNDGLDVKLSKAGTEKADLKKEIARINISSGKQGNAMGELKAKVNNLETENKTQGVEIATLKAEAVKAETVKAEEMNQRIGTLEKENADILSEFRALQGVAKHAAEKLETLEATNAQSGERAEEISRLTAELSKAREVESRAQERILSLESEARRRPPPAASDLEVKTIHHNGTVFYTEDKTTGHQTVRLSLEAIKRAGLLDRDIKSEHVRVPRGFKDIDDGQIRRTKSDPNPRVAKPSTDREIDTSQAL